MHSASIALLLVGLVVVGMIPIAVLVAWLARRTDTEGRSRPTRTLAIVLAVVVALALGGGWYVLASSRQPGSASDGMAGMATSPASPAGGVPSLPDALAGIPEASSVTGDEAIQDVARLHGKDFAILGAAIADYAGARGKAQVWVAVAGNASDAAGMAKKMAERISAGGSPFEPPRLAAGTADVWVTKGLGQVHYFFARGAAVWWLSVDAGPAEQALGEVLGAAGS